METTRQDRVARDALASLPVWLRTPYVMRRMANASDQDIAEALRVSRAGVARRLRWAEARLQQSFQAAGFGDVAMDAALDAYLTIPPASDFVPRVMEAIRRLPRHPAPMPPARYARASLWVCRLTTAIVAIIGVLSVVHYARVVKTALAALWPR